MRDRIVYAISGAVLLTAGFFICRWWWPACCPADGVIPINQQIALAGGVNANDTPGFPVSIDESGSYRLTGNLTVQSADDMAILIGNAQVTIDLNGFEIRGPTTCTKTPVDAQITCNNVGMGRGIWAVGGGHVAIFNGIVSGFGADGIMFEGGTGGWVDRVQVYNNGSVGLLAGRVTNSTAHHNGGGGIAGGIIEGSAASYNGSDGISASRVLNSAASYNDRDGIITSAGIVTNSIAHNNGRYGIHLTGGVNVANSQVAIGNSASENGSYGIFISQLAVAGYANNVLTGNGGTVSGGTQMGTNICNGNTTCP